MNPECLEKISDLHPFPFSSKHGLQCNEQLSNIDLILYNQFTKRLYQFDWTIIKSENCSNLRYTHKIFLCQTNKELVLELCDLVEKHGEKDVLKLVDIFGNSNIAIKFLIYFLKNQDL